MYLRFAKKINFIMLLHKLLLRYSSMVDTHAHFNIWLEQRITVSPPVNILYLYLLYNIYKLCDTFSKYYSSTVNMGIYFSEYRTSSITGMGPLLGIICLEQPEMLLI